MTTPPERSPSLRPTGAYVHGIDGAPVVVVSARVAAWLLVHTDLARHRVDVRGTDPEVDAQLGALTYVGNLWRTATSATSAATGSGLVEVPEVAASSGFMSSTEAADLLGVTDRAVRLACTGGRLPAARIDGRWQISRDDFDTYRRTRAA